MFGTNERFNLIRASYARSGSNTFISEDFYKLGQLQLGNNWTGTWLSLTDYLFDMKLLINGAPTAYTYFADAGSLKLSACCAEVEVALTDRSHFRVRGENAGLRLELRSATAGNGAKACRGFYSLPDGSGWEGDFGRYGKLFIKAITGNYTVTTLFDEEKNAYSLVRIDFMPDAETGEFDAAIHDYREALLPFGEYEDFDEIVENNYAEFEEFRKIYRAPASGYEEMTKYAEWMIWSHRTKAIGQFKQPHILYQNAWTCTAAPWQQSYNAMPMLCDPAEAWRLICLMFLYQVESSGRIPGMVSYINPPQAGNQSAFQGFALEFLIRKLGEDFITADEAERMYPKMAAWADFWTTYRSAGFGDDVIAIHSPGDSGWDDASLFKDGFPVVEPGVNALQVLLMECLAILAKRSYSYKEMQDNWTARAKKLTDTLINEYWNGEMFVAKKDGKAVVSQSLANYQPIILGKRLPQHIIDKCAEKLTEEGLWLTEIGLASESMQSELTTFGVSFVLGRVVGPQNMIMAVGLQAAGKQKEAEIIARHFCDHVNREGIILGYAPYNYYKHNGDKARQQRPPIQADAWPWSPWTANCYLTMVTEIIGK